MRRTAPQRLGSSAPRLLASLAPWLLLACGAVEVREDRYYRLEPPGIAAGRTAAVVLRVDDFSVAPHLAGDRLLVAVDDLRLEAHDGEFWAAPLDRLVTEAVLGGLLESGRFRAVLDNRDRGRADATLSGRVVNFEEVRANGGWAGRAKLACVLREHRTGRVLWQGTLAATEPAASDEAEHAVAALNRALGNLLTRVAAIADKSYGSSDASVSPGK